MPSFIIQLAPAGRYGVEKTILMNWPNNLRKDDVLNIEKINLYTNSVMLTNVLLIFGTIAFLLMSCCFMVCTF